MKTLDLGSYSHGTLRDEDLADTLRDMLRSMEHDDSALLSDLDAIVEDSHMDYASEVIDDAIDALQEYAPPFCYVGFHEGDGSDLGVWLDHDAFESACRDGEILKVADSSEIDARNREEVASHAYIAIVSDHGNVSLYTVKVTLGEEVLSVV